MKPNAMIPIYDEKQSKVYMINVTTKKFYFHCENFNSTNIIILALIGGGFSRLAQTWRSQLYLYSPTQNFKVLIIILVLLIGALLLWLLIKKRYQPQLKEYLKEYPEEIICKSDRDKVLNKALGQVIMIMLASVFSLVFSSLLFYRFLNDSNLVTFFTAALLFLVFSATLSRMDHAIFILKLVTEMKSKVRD